MPTPDEWAQQQLQNAPHRSAQWARRVARIYCLDIGDSDSHGDSHGDSQGDGDSDDGSTTE